MTGIRTKVDLEEDAVKADLTKATSQVISSQQGAATADDI